jgi:predicted phosphodiesterase
VRALLFDVHGNLPALEAVLADARTAGADGFVLGGDYTLFGAWPAETVALLRELEAVWIRGNGERWTGDPASAPDDELIQQSIADCRKRLGEVLTRELEALPESMRLDGMLVCHASPKSDLETFGPEPADEDQELLAGASEGTIVFGHSHVQFSRTANGRRLVNPGSVGMPLDGDRRAAYVLWHGGENLEPRRVEYDADRYAQEVRARLGPALGETVDRLVGRIERASFA